MGRFHGIIWFMLIAAIAALSLTACEGIGQTPFSLQIASFNEQGPQEPAVITISDPQIYARETLINDRLREKKLLDALLDETTELSGDDDFRKRFKPQMNRDIETLSALTMQLGVAYNQLQGLQTSRQDKLDELQNTLEMARLERQIEEERQKRDNLTGTEPLPAEAAAEAKASADAAKASAAEAKASAAAAKASAGEPSAADPEIKRIKDRLTTLYTHADNLLEKLKTNAGADSNVRETKVEASPRDQYRDLQSYRSEIRQALNAVNLDDLHDYEGNALYRMQFRASVMPGRHKDKFGVARLTILPPRLSDSDVNELYRAWLAHLTYRLNQPFPANRDKCPALRMSSLPILRLRLR